MARSKNRSRSPGNRDLVTSRITLSDVLVSSPVLMDETVLGDLSGPLISAAQESPWLPSVTPKKAPPKFRDLRKMVAKNIRADAFNPCAARKQRRQVLFAKQKTRAGRGRPKRYTKWSLYRC